MKIQYYISLLCSNDPLAEDLLKAYSLPALEKSLVGVSVKEGTVHVFPTSNASQPALREWLISLRDGQLEPTSKYTVCAFYVGSLLSNSPSLMAVFKL